MRKDQTHLQKELVTLGEELPSAELLPAKRKEQSPDPKKKDASREEFRRLGRAPAGSLSTLSYKTQRELIL